MNSEHVKKTGFAITAIIVMAAASGCCNTTNNCPPQARQPAYASKYRRVRAPGGGFLYSLGSGMTTNSSSVGLGDRCAPAPAKAPDCLPCETPAPDIRPASAPAPAPQTGARVTESDDFPSLGSVCDSPGGDMFGACYTLSDEEAASGPMIVVPNAGALETLSRLERTGDDPAIPETASVPAETAEEPVETMPESAIEPVVAAEEPAMPETAAPAVAAAESELPTETAVAAAPVLDMPPVFRKGATEAAAAEVLSRIGKVESIDALSPVELPPDL